MASKKKKQCKKGFACGRTCINKSRICRSNLGPTGEKIVENYAQFVERIAAQDKPKQITPEEFLNNLPSYNEIVTSGNYEILGEGGFGAVGRAKGLPGQVFKVFDQGFTRAQEFELQEKAANLGINTPRVTAIKKAGEGLIESVLMDEIKGSPVENFASSGSLDNSETALKLVDELEKVYKSKIAHQDFNSENILYDPNKEEFSIIDWGIAEDGVRASLQDIAGSFSVFDITKEEVFPNSLNQAWNSDELRSLAESKLREKGIEFEELAPFLSRKSDEEINNDPAFVEAYEETVNEYFGRVKNRLNRAASGVDPLQGVTAATLRESDDFEVLGEGSFGLVGRINFRNGQVIKVPTRGGFDQKEIDMHKLATEKGLNTPKLIEDLKDETGNTTGIVMEEVTGRNLMNMMADPEVFDSVVTIENALKVLELTESMHRAGIAHQDYAAHNLMMDDQGNLSVIDWGFADNTPSAVLDEMTYDESIFVRDMVQGDFAGVLDDVYDVKEAQQIALDQLSARGFNFADYDDLQTKLFKQGMAQELDNDPNFQEAVQFATMIIHVTAQENLRSKL